MTMFTSLKLSREIGNKRKRIFSLLKLKGQSLEDLTIFLNPIC